MTQTTERPAPGSPGASFGIEPWKVRWLVLLTIGTILLAAGTGLTIERGGIFISIANLPVVAARSTLELAINEFSGSPVTRMAGWEYLGAFINLVLIWFIAPTVFLFGWRSLAAGESGGTALTKGKRAGVVLGFVLGGAFTATILIANVPGYLAHRSVFHSVQKEEALQHERDDMFNAAQRVYYDAYQYFILPKDMGGGGNSYVGYSPGDDILKEDRVRQATIVLKDVRPGSIILRAESKLYPGCAVGFTINSAGQATNVVREGAFESYVPTFFLFEGIQYD